MAKGEVRVNAVSGGQLAALARDLRRAGAITLRRELYKGLQRSGKPAIEKIRKQAGVTLPKGGGRGRRRTRLVDTGTTLTNAVSGRTHKVKVKRKIAGNLGAGESLAQRVQGASFAVRTTAGANPGVRLIATERGGHSIDVDRLDRGEVRHKVYGRWRKGTPTQRVKPGWFTAVAEANVDEFRKGIDDAVSAVEKEISGR